MTQYEDRVERARNAERERRDGWNFKYREYNYPTLKWGFNNEVEVIIRLDGEPNKILLPEGATAETREGAYGFLKEELRLRKKAGV